MKKTGVRGLAQATGLSVATISRVLNNADNVNKDTRERVLEAIRAAGYKPNPAARALATKRTRTIGAVVPTLAHSIFARFLNAVERELAQFGYALVIATTEGEPEAEERRVGELMDMGAEALILSGAEHSQALLARLDAAGVPAVCTSVCETANGLPAVGYDNCDIGRAAVTHLASVGHRRIAVLHGPKSDNDRTRLRIAGVENGARRAGVSVILQETALDVEGGVEGARALLDGTQDFSAVLCLSDVIALGVLFECNRRGLTIPKDISLMGCDDLDWAANSTPPLTTVRLPTARMGALVATSLAGLLDEDKPIRTARLEASIVERASVASPAE
ncbi:LacI family DNA-binding transcriptional regulator [Hoeflea prorocentri]|uniref:LacI family DNA-binding transcriptional regulator n=1 Tax=Hoeflea prorocentri TaxID=1922333 RepID=A0A9X3ZIJ1_9HYPH|nr:LacI family DNA-binding transcriptional regulator [Hoeflea prorocentri]MCY6382063.1 LacI family DNA-binding transcriptional regulator [Hoeflea prorocentri]MDA5399863.1 LacI family DNA-binding transcriptional regulator [Hoeflea prorocentri]